MSEDGVALISRAHPRGTWWGRLLLWLRRPQLSPDSLETVEIELIDMTKADANKDPPRLELSAPGRAPRVTLAQIEGLIRFECYITGDQIPVAKFPDMPKEERDFLHQRLSCLTVCVLVLKNGTSATGESACVSRANFNAQLGEKLAREKAIEKIWALEGYLLSQALHEAGASNKPVREGKV